jgi:hypothetical protein
VVDPARAEELAAALAGFGLHYSLEVWDEDRTELLHEIEG